MSWTRKGARATWTCAAIGLTSTLLGCGYSAAQESSLLRSVVFQPIAGDGSSIEPIHTRRSAALREHIASADTASLDSVTR